ncbi:MAG TPA: transposase, partial [Hymenobacter sp.]|nr:transposase [Hymenobacter sp.]
ARLVSNKTHDSPTDPEARISIKLGKVRALNYLCSLAVDTPYGVSSHVQADLADSRDSIHLPGLVTQLQQRLLTHGLPLQDLVADTNYSNGVNYALLEQQGITPWIPVFGQYKPVVEGFAYDVETDSFTCPAGKLLPFRSYETSLDGGLFKTYRASTRDCRCCPRQVTCAPQTNKRKITRTADDPHYRRALLRQQSRQGQRMRLMRQSTVEPVFGSLLPHYGLRQVNTHGRASAHKTMLLTAIAFNLKKLLKYQPQRQASLAMALPKPPIIAVLRTVYTYEHCRAGFRPSQLGRNRPNKGGLQPALFGWGVH